MPILHANQGMEPLQVLRAEVGPKSQLNGDAVRLAPTFAQRRGTRDIWFGSRRYCRLHTACMLLIPNYEFLLPNRGKRQAGAASLPWRRNLPATSEAK